MNNNLTKQFVQTLIEERDFLCWQLTNATGGLTEEQFEEIVTEHFKNRIEKSQEQLNYEAKELFELIGEKMDSELTSIILKCSLDEASIALKHVANKVNKVNEGKLCTH